MGKITREREKGDGGDRQSGGGGGGSGEGLPLLYIGEVQACMLMLFRLLYCNVMLT